MDGSGEKRPKPRGSVNFGALPKDTVDTDGLQCAPARRTAEQGGLSLDASEMLLRSQRKLHHAFQELVRRQADEVVHDELLGVEAPVFLPARPVSTVTQA